MPRLTDLISKAKSGRSVKDLLSSEAGQPDPQSVDGQDALIDQIALVEAAFFALDGRVQSANLKPVLSELELIAADI